MEHWRYSIPVQVSAKKNNFNVTSREHQTVCVLGQQSVVSLSFTFNSSIWPSKIPIFFFAAAADHIKKWITFFHIKVTLKGRYTSQWLLRSSDFWEVLAAVAVSSHTTRTKCGGKSGPNNFLFCFFWAAVAHLLLRRGRNTARSGPQQPPASAF